MPRLRGQIAAFIVTRLASFDRPKDVQEAVREMFEVDVPLPQIIYYDGTAKSANLSRKLRRLFDATRERATKEISDIPIAHRAVRLRRTNRLADKAEDMRNYALAGQLLEQAAKETGDFYTNRRVVAPADAAGLAAELGKLLGADPSDLLAAVAGGEQ